MITVFFLWFTHSQQSGLTTFFHELAGLPESLRPWKRLIGADPMGEPRWTIVPYRPMVGEGVTSVWHTGRGLFLPNDCVLLPLTFPDSTMLFRSAFSAPLFGVSLSANPSGSWAVSSGVSAWIRRLLGTLRFASAFMTSSASPQSPPHETK